MSYITSQKGSEDVSVRWNMVMAKRWSEFLFILKDELLVYTTPRGVRAFIYRWPTDLANIMQILQDMFDKSGHLLSALN